MQHRKVSIQSYEGHPIAFDFTKSRRLINLSNMAKSFGKQPSDFTRQQHTKRFIEELKKQSGKSPIEIKRGGKNPGTWGHELLALKFAGWLAPKFELWMMERIRELLAAPKPVPAQPTIELGKRMDAAPAPTQLTFELMEAAPYEAGKPQGLMPEGAALAEYEEARQLCIRLASIMGSLSRLSVRLGVSAATLSQLKNRRFGYVHPPILAKLLTAMRHIDRHGFGYDTEMVELLMQVKDDKVRTRLFAKLKNNAAL